MFKNVFIITLFSIITRTIGFLFRIYLSRAIGAEALGIYQACLSMFFVLLTFVSSGIPLIVSRNQASLKVFGNKKQKSSLASSALVLSGIICAVLCIFVLAFNKLLCNLFLEGSFATIIVTLLPSLIFSAVYCSLRGVMWGEGRFTSLCLAELFEEIVKIATTIMLLRGLSSAESLANACAKSFSISCFFSAIFVFVQYFALGGSFSKPKCIKQISKQAFPITAVRVISSLGQPIVAIIIPWRLMTLGFSSAEAMTLYGICIGMTFPLLFLPTALIGSLSTALVPDLSGALASNNISHAHTRIRSSLIFAMFISCMVASVYLGLGTNIGVFLYNQSLAGSLLEIASFSVVAIGLTNITCAILNSTQNEMKSFANSVTGSVLCLVLLLVLPSLIGINAIVVAFGAANALNALLNIISIKKRLNINYNITKKCLVMLLAILPCSALSCFVANLLSLVLPQFFVLLFAGIISVASFALLCFAFGIYTLEISNFVQTKIKPKLKRKKA